jgi:WD40 repeat protein
MIQILKTIKGHSGPVNTSKFSSDGHFFVSGGADQLVMVWKSNLNGVLNNSDEAPVIEWGQGSRPRSSPSPGKNILNKNNSGSLKKCDRPLPKFLF